MSNENAESQQEPSMEEILASIRRIISEDDEPGADASDGDTAPMEDASTEPDPPPPPPPPPEPDPEPAPEFDTAEDEPDPEPEPAPPPPPPPPPPEPKPAAVPQDDVLELTNVVEEAPKPKAPAGDQYIDLNRPPMQSHNIVSDQPAVSTSEYFARLAIIAQERGQLGGSITVEELSRELMRPMLQAWLDENLPRIVERQVQNEIERIVRKAHDL